jgi:hypothetical protein
MNYFEQCQSVEEAKNFIDNYSNSMTGKSAVPVPSHHPDHAGEEDETVTWKEPVTFCQSVQHLRHLDR